MTNCLSKHVMSAFAKRTGHLLPLKFFMFLLLLLAGNSLFAQTKVSGKISAGDTSLQGATILVKGKNISTKTDENGLYTIDAPANATLVISYVGYISQEIKVNNRTSIDIQMTNAISQMGEVVVVGYGTQKKGNITGSISTVNAEKLSVAPVGNTTTLLTGRLPGLVAKQSSGQPGFDDASLSIRGFGNALLIVDGIEARFNNIDANQIESISILKDGSASIYGARAGNGVILITTKRGSNSKPIINVNSSYTLQGVTEMLRPASSGQRTRMEREAYIQSGQPESGAPWTEEAIEKYFAGNDPAYLNTDWFHYTFRKWAPQQNHNVSVRGGNGKIRYYGFFGYTDQETMIRTNGGDYKRYNAQSNVDAAITKNLTIRLDMSLAFENRMFPIRGVQNGGAFWQDYYMTKPWYPSTLPDPAKVAWGGLDVGSIATVSNIDLMGYNSSKGTDLRAAVTLDYNFESVKGLKAKAFVNYNSQDSYGKSFYKPIVFYTYNPTTEVYTQAASFTQSLLQESISRGNVLTQQYSLSYENTFRDVHRVSGLALFETIAYNNNQFNASRANLLTPLIDQLFIGSTVGMGNNGFASEMGRNSYLGRINYSFKDRYLVETILRADASARFAEDNRWGYFPGVSVGWMMNKEKFMQNIRAIDNLKIRASYGQSGNDAVGNFQYLAGYSIRGTSILDNAPTAGIYVTGLANPLLTWEKMSIYNGGADFSLLSRKLYGSLDVFYRERNGIPATRATSLPSTFGSSLPAENLNSLRDHGFELMLGTAHNAGNFSYEISGNIAYSRSKWKHYEEPDYADPDQKAIYQISGHWTDRVMGFVSEGLFTSQAEIDALPYVYKDLNGNSSLRPGDVKYKDLNGDGVLDYKDQKDIGKGSLPHWTYGINTTLNYKNFDFSALFQGAFGYNTLINLTQYPNAKEYELRWTEENNDAHALVPRLGGAGTNSYTSDYRYKATSYLRLKVASIGYELPRQLLDKWGVSKLRFYLSGTNLLTLNNLKEYGIDPENANSIMVYPQQRTISFGLNVSL